MIEDLEQFKLKMKESNPEVLCIDDYDDAIIGVARRCGQPDLIAYSYRQMIEVMMKRDKCEQEDAMEWIEFNCVGAWMGPHTPVIVEDL